MKTTALILSMLGLGLGGCIGGSFSGSNGGGGGGGDDIGGDDDTADARPAVPTPDAAPPPPIDDGRVKEGLAGLYKFRNVTGTIVADESGAVPPLDLTITDPAAVTLGADGVTVIAPTILSTERALKIYEPCVAAKAITIEAWVTPASTDTANVPERIAGMSIDPATRDFSLIQQNANYEARVRTTETNENGIPAVTTPGVTTLVQHVVYTRGEDGTTMTYLDGVGTPGPIILGSFVGWNSNYSFHVANEATLDRPWLGTLHLVGVRDLTQLEVSQNFAAGY